MEIRTPEDIEFAYHMSKIEDNKKASLEKKQWDNYFLKICSEVSENSKCLSRKVGAILVRENRILCTGYNGPPSGVPHCGERYELDQNLIQALKDRENG